MPSASASSVGSTTDANRVELVAVTIAIAVGDVSTTAFVDGARAIADSAIVIGAHQSSTSSQMPSASASAVSLRHTRQGRRAGCRHNRSRRQQCRRHHRRRTRRAGCRRSHSPHRGCHRHRRRHIRRVASRNRHRPWPRRQLQAVSSVQPGTSSASHTPSHRRRRRGSCHRNPQVGFGIGAGRIDRLGHAIATEGRLRVR